MASSSGNTFLAAFQYDTSRSLFCLLSYDTTKRKNDVRQRPAGHEVNEAITMTTISSLELRSKITSEASRPQFGRDQHD